MPFESDDAPWYRQRSYAHFDRRPTRQQVLRYVRDPKKVASHGFFPFIMRPVRVCHFKEDAAGRRRHTHKVRPVTYAAHMDTHIHAYYAHLLNERLEARLCADFGDSVLAYRKRTPPKNNIDFALEAFAEVVGRGEVDVLAIDVQGFFDGLNHEILKKAWQDLLEVDRLDDDHYAVFRSVTMDYAIEWPKVRLALQEQHRRRAGTTGAPVCGVKDFRAKLAPLAEPRHSLVWKVKGKDPPSCIPVGVPVGIPQGSAISAVLANLYMLSVDSELFVQLGAIGASYRRYSDDILVIAPAGQLGAAEAIIKAVLAKVKLAINDDKTEKLEFRHDGTRLTSTFVTPSGARHAGRPMQYLGLSFNGDVARLRDGTMSRYLIRMHRAVDRGRIAGSKRGHEKIRRRKLYATMSRLGAGKAYGPWQLVDGRWQQPEHAPRPGFLAYARRADDKAGVAVHSDISRQNRRAWDRLHVALARSEKKLK